MQVALRLSGRQPFHNVPVCSGLGRCWGAVSLCARRKEQRSAQIADICSFFLNPPHPLPPPPPRWSTATQCGYRVSEPLARHTGGWRRVCVCVSVGWGVGGSEARRGGSREEVVGEGGGR